MKNFYLSLVAILLLSQTSFSQLVTPAWIDSIPGHYGFGNEVAIGPDGYVYSAGCVSLNAAYQRRLALIKLDRSGNRIWKFQSDTIVNGGLNGEAIALTIGIDGYIYIAGSKAFNIGGDEDMWVYKIDTSGNVVWDRRYVSPFTNYDKANDVAVDDSGNVYITGIRSNLNNFKEIVTIKFDSSGTILWTNLDYVNNTSASMGANEIRVDALGNVYVAGEEGFFTSPTAKTRSLLISYDAAGNQRWRKTYSPNLNYNTDGKSLEVDGDFNSYISGKSSDNSAYIIKYDSSGDQKWIYNYPGAYGTDLVLSAAGNLYMTGCWWDTINGGVCDMLLAKLDTAGNVLWTTTSGGNNYTYDYGLNIITDASDNVFMSGVYSDSTTIDGMSIIKYTAIGNFDWIGGFPGNTCFTLNSTLGTAVDDSGSVYTTSSYCDPGSVQHYLTLKYGSLNTGVQELDNIKMLKIFPNPTNGNATIQFYLRKHADIKIRIFDLLGEEKPISFNSAKFDSGLNAISFDASSFENGIYFFQLVTDEETVNKQFVVSR